MPASFLVGTQRITDRGRLEIGGCDAVELAAHFGTPLYVMDEQEIRNKCRAYKQAVETLIPGGKVVYAAKAFQTLAICRLVADEGLSLDIASPGELYTALQAGFPAERIIHHGNYKSREELTMSLDAGVGRIVVDSEIELDTLNELAAARGSSADILLRLTPAVDPHTHEFIQTGKVDTKFGFGIATGQAAHALKKALALPQLNLCGVHSHIGSQLLDTDSFELAVELLAEFLKSAKDELNFESAEWNLGGGLGIRYVRDHRPPKIDAFVGKLASAIREQFGARGLATPRILLEPGRSIVGEAGVTLYTVGVVKHVPGVRKYVSVDGGLSDNPRPALYDAKYSALVANKSNVTELERVTISGKHCETDTLIENIDLPPLEPDDILAVQCTGAYNYSMASNYNRFTRPAVVLVNAGQAEVIVRRETLDDLISHDEVPARLQ